MVLGKQKHVSKKKITLPQSNDKYEKGITILGCSNLERTMKKNIKLATGKAKRKSKHYFVSPIIRSLTLIMYQLFEVSLDLLRI